MANTYSLTAISRTDLGKGASRRLRRENLIPAIIYGGSGDAISISLKKNEMDRNLLDEAFYSALITLDVNGTKEVVVLRDLQRHPAKPFVLHADLQRVMDDEEIKVVVPFHFLNEEDAPGTKDGGNTNRLLTDVEISCLPKNIPEFIDVDMSELERGQSIHLSEITFPEGVVSTQLSHGEEHNLAVVTIY